MSNVPVQQAELIAQIERAFAGVSREGGVSWSESYVIDDYGDMSQRLAARAHDRERGWLELVDDPQWIIHLGGGGFSFLDAVGFRYYLPATMVRVIRGTNDDSDEALGFALTLRRGTLHDHIMQTWSILTDDQRRCVAVFLQFMQAREADEGLGPNWVEALDSYWRQYL